MNNFKIKIIRWLSGYLILFSASCRQHDSYKTFVPTKEDSLQQQAVISNAYRQIDSVKYFIKSGDLITRTGNDFTSESLRSLNQRDRTYSHCGIASIEHDSVFVYHALGGDFNPDQKIRRDPIELFAEPATNKGIGIFRFLVPDSNRLQYAAQARNLFKKGIMFDMDFDLATDDRMYCAEYVYKVLVKASRNTLSFNHSYIKGFEFIGVDDIFLNPLCRMQARLVYKLK